MFAHLQIPYRRERLAVGLADAGLSAISTLGWPRTARAIACAAPRRILLLRLERVGDLLMVLEPLAMVRALAPTAQIDLVVGSWNAAIGGLIPHVDCVEVLDVPWMARHGRGVTWPDLVRRARSWAARDYDLAINFEPDIRSNLFLALSGARRRVGFGSGGGGAVLTDAVTPDPRAHIAENARALVNRAFPGGTAASSFSAARLKIPDAARHRAAELVATPPDGRPLIGLQPAAGRQIKEWDPLESTCRHASLSIL